MVPLIALRGRRFTSDEEVKEAVHEWLAGHKSAKDIFFCGYADACGTLEQVY
jgi:hypothetical protein